MGNFSIKKNYVKLEVQYCKEVIQRKFLLIFLQVNYNNN